jgi:hypothetical protein
MRRLHLVKKPNSRHAKSSVSSRSSSSPRPIMELVPKSLPLSCQHLMTLRHIHHPAAPLFARILKLVVARDVEKQPDAHRQILSFFNRLQRRQAKMRQYITPRRKRSGQ